jgi:hypothetical protein
MNDLQRLIEQATERCDSINTMCSDQRRATKEVLTSLVSNALAVAERAEPDFSNPLCNINDTLRARDFMEGPSGNSTEDRVIALAQAYDRLVGIVGDCDFLAWDNSTPPQLWSWRGHRDESAEPCKRIKLITLPDPVTASE